MKHRNISVTFTRGRHEQVYGSRKGSRWNRGGDVDTQREVVNVYRELDKSRTQILVERRELRVSANQWSFLAVAGVASRIVVA